ncbi:hypothetical protein D3C80_1652510 [compost metagenome]
MLLSTLHKGCPSIDIYMTDKLFFHKIYNTIQFEFCGNLRRIIQASIDRMIELILKRFSFLNMQITELLAIHQREHHRISAAIMNSADYLISN